MEQQGDDGRHAVPAVDPVPGDGDSTAPFVFFFMYLNNNRPFLVLSI